MKKDILIIGAGLSGITVAVHLIRKGHSVTLVDNEKNYSSAIAAGQINPMVFRRMTKSWRLDELLPYAEKFYRELENDTNQLLYHPITIRRMFSSEQEKQFWLEKQHQEQFKNYLEPISDEDESYSLAKNEFGSGRLKGSSYVNTVPFLTAGKEWVAQRGGVVKEQADYQDIDPEKCTYKGKKFDELVFCEGVNSRENPWFGNLPIEFTKGEVLTVSSDKLDQKESLNRKCFLLPIGNQTFRLGATYTWRTNNLELTKDAKNELLEKVKYLTEQPLQVLEHKAGIRPTTPDRRPIIGRHPDYPNLSIFNGLGTKGYLLAPKMAAEFVDFLIDGKTLDREVMLNRFLN